ncbi:unnamed protein product [marine sediment metagenome]|uniref:Uncharacterized protein n=1 Tax=marine sediment metagenome TaxID=412755 RepID=X1DJ42_9ZZZZ
MSAFKLQDSSYNHIIYNKISSVFKCFQEIGDCIANIFVNNECTETPVVNYFYLDPLWVSIIFNIGIVAVAIYLFIKYRALKKVVSTP